MILGVRWAAVMPKISSLQRRAVSGGFAVHALCPK